MVLRLVLHETRRVDKVAADESIKEGRIFPKDVVKLAKLRVKAQRYGDEELHEANTSVVQVAVSVVMRCQFAQN